MRLLPLRRTWTRRHTVAAAATAAVLVAATGLVVSTAQPSETVVTAGSPTSPPTPAPTPTPTRRPTPSAPASRPTTKPAPSNPLTGGRASGHEVFAVKIENIPAARPQAGLDQADIVFAEEVEGQQTRLVALYHTTFPKRIGPVRSARNTDIELLGMFGNPGLVYSGANRRVQRNIERSDLRAVQRTTRDPRRVVPHNVFVDLADLARSVRVGKARPFGWTFAENDPKWSAAGRHGAVSGRVGRDRFDFEFVGGRYVVRWQGRTYTNGGSAPKATADNVLVMRVRNVADGNRDVNGAPSVKSRTVGRGEVVIRRDGRVRFGTWRRDSAEGPLRLLDKSGRDIALKPGKTWVLLSG